MHVGTYVLAFAINFHIMFYNIMVFRVARVFSLLPNPYWLPNNWGKTDNNLENFIHNYSLSCKTLKKYRLEGIAT